MARRPFDPAAEGWEKVVLPARRHPRPRLAGGALRRRRRRRPPRLRDLRRPRGDPPDQSRGQPQRLRSRDRRPGSKRLVYASSVAAYGFHAENPQPLTEDVPARGSESFYYSAQKAELEATLDELLGGSGVDAYVFRPCIVAGPRATMLIEKVGRGRPARRPAAGPAPGPRPPAAARPVLPDIGAPIQLVHHDDVARALAAAIAGRRRARRLQPRRRRRARGSATSPGRWAGARSRCPAPPSRLGAGVAGRLTFLSPQLEWAAALRMPVLMDTRKARGELGWEPRFDAAETLIQTAVSAREAGRARVEFENRCQVDAQATHY